MISTNPTNERHCKITIAAAARLHFGMLSFGRPGVRHFGGLGAMVAPPGLRLSIEPAARFSVGGAGADRVRTFAESILRRLQVSAPLPCRIEVVEPLPAHSGLGSGTQTALSVAAGLLTFLGHPLSDAAQLARLAGRGARSAIGTHGFLRGGLLLEGGKWAPDALSPLVARAPLPEHWRFLLVRPDVEPGLSGKSEKQAFARLPPVSAEITDALCRIAYDEVVPAALAADFDRFADALYRYSTLAGSCFAAAQGGPFNGPILSGLVARLRELGAVGVGQSSWGPTLFAAMSDEPHAWEMAARLRAGEHQPLEIAIAAPANQGARICVGNESEEFGGLV